MQIISSLILTLIISYFMTFIFTQNSTIEIFFIVQIITFIQAFIGKIIESYV